MFSIRLRQMMAIAILAAICLLSAARATANDAIRYLTGTTFTDAATGQSYAYLRWQSQDPEALRNWPTVVYSKAGNPASPGPFARAGTIALQTQPSVLETLANSFPGEFFDRAGFEAIIQDFFGEFATGPGITLGEQLSTILQLARADPDIYSRVLMLTYAEPFMAVCLGVAAVIPMPADVATFELRAPSDPAAGGPSAEVVVGRVILDRTDGINLPAPNGLIQIPDREVTGHLNAKLRWNLSSSILRATPSMFGFNLFRIERTLVESNNYHVVPPSAVALQQLLSNHPAAARQLNRAAILPVDAANPDTPFFTDDNDAAFGIELPLQDGDQYYYFVSARDLLGRSGPVSRGVLVTICARQPPESPRRVKVGHFRSYDSTTQTATARLKVEWRPHPNAGTTVPLGYRVYRWESVSEMQTLTDPAQIAARQVSNLIPHVPGQTRYEWVDDSVGAPDAATDAAMNTWYSVKTVIDTSCGILSSGDSAPGWGSLRDFIGPENSPMSIALSSTEPTMIVNDPPDLSLSPSLDAGFSGPTGDVRYLSVLAAAAHPAIRSFTLGLAVPLPAGGLNFRPITTVEFTEENWFHFINQRIPAELYAPAANVRIWAQATDAAGRVARIQGPLNALLSDNSIIKTLEIAIGLTTDSVVITPGDTVPDGFSHRPVDPSDGTLNPLTLGVEVPADAREYKVYKRINGGPLVFFSQATDISPPGSVVEITDDAFPPYGAEICYYLQWFDTHGNPSPLGLIGCIPVAAKLTMPVPVLEQPLAGGDDAQPTARLRWFCPPDGIERFRVYVGDGETPVPLAQSGNLSVPTFGYKTIPFFTASTTIVSQVPATRIGQTNYYPLETGRVGGDFGDPANPGIFELEVDVLPGRTYQFYVVSVSAAGDLSPRSNIESFEWIPGATGSAAEPLVPWPARGLPALDTSFNPSLAAQVISDTYRFNGIGIRIGNYYGSDSDLVLGGRYIADNILFSQPTRFPDHPSSSISLYTSPNGESILPCLVYRYEIDPNTLEPATGNIVQVSPLIEDLLLRSDGTDLRLYNPFVDIFSLGIGYGVFIKDTQPVIRGKSYRYLLVRLQENGEIDRVITLPIVTAPANP